MESINKEELVTLLKEVIAEAVESHPLSDDEVEWVRMAIEEQARKAKFRQAVIDKTLIGLMASGLLWMGSKMIEVVMAHWK
jgi:F0F1-type ATP synthase delta subunit